MAKGMTKTALVRAMAEKLEITNKQAAAGLELLAEMAVKETKKNGEFTIPGIGKLVKAERKARMGRNPQTGEPIKIKAKTVVKFRVAKVAKDTIAPPKKRPRRSPPLNQIKLSGLTLLWRAPWIWARLPRRQRCQDARKPFCQVSPRHRGVRPLSYLTRRLLTRRLRLALRRVPGAPFIARPLRDEWVSRASATALSD